MVDAAREYLPLTSLKQYVTMCRLFKLNHLHIHFTDDVAFTFPSTAYPQLPAHSKFAYTLSEMHELQAFAVVRGVTIIGEMDVPGHATSIANVLPDVFGTTSLGCSRVWSLVLGLQSCLVPRSWAAVFGPWSLVLGLMQSFGIVLIFSFL